MNKRLIQSVAFALCIIWTGLAWGHGDLSRFPDSVQIEQYRLNIWLNPDDLETRNNLAMAYFRSKKLDEAENELRYVIDKDPQNFNGLDGLGIVLIKKKRLKEALGYLEKAAVINEKDVLLHVHLYVVYEKMNMHEEAESELNKARALAAGTDEAELIDKEIDLVGGS
jgi:tetratricopeptide (TPR) repeat protein